MVGVFFFKQKTAYEMRISDWSSDVCSSDLGSGSAGSACLATEWSWVRRGLAPAAKTADPAATESTPVQRPCSRTAPTAQPNTGRIRQIGRASSRERGCQDV